MASQNSIMNRLLYQLDMDPDPIWNWQAALSELKFDRPALLTWSYDSQDDYDDNQY